MQISCTLYFYSQMSLIISMVSIVGVSMSLFCDSLNLAFVNYSAVDMISLSMLWLCVGTALSVISSNLVKSNVVMWWWLILVLLMSFSSTSIFLFYIFFEASLIPILIMILSFGSQPERLSAGAYLMFYTTFISVPYMVYIFMMPGTEMNFMVQYIYWGSSGAMLMFLIPFLIKMPMFGFHFWLPKAHVEASTSGSMVLAGMLLKLGSYGAARIMGSFLIHAGMVKMSSLWIILSGLSSVITFMQSDIKKMVAYSSVTHMTFLVVGLLTMTKMTLISVILVSLAHAWAAMAMFLTAGTLSHSASSRLGMLLGSEMSLLWLSILFGLILVSNAGIPPMPSFFPESLILMSCFSVNGYSGVLFIVMSFFVCYYNAYLFMWISHLKPTILLSSKAFYLEGLLVLAMIMLGLESLLWMQMF